MAKRALLVNDSKFESRILKDMLQQLDYSVEIADEFDALYAIERFEPDVVIVNYIMEQTRGDKLIQLMKAGMPHLKCILSSSNSIRISEMKGRHVDAILHTPVSMYILETIMNQIEAVENVEQEDTKCPSCHKDLADFSIELAFCPYCGERLAQR